LIDTGEEENVLVEYLLDRRINTIDYIMISHFDSDHCFNAREVIEKLKVKNLIISMQAEKTNEFEDIMKLAQSNGVHIIQVEAGCTLNIDKYVYFNILWPNNNKLTNSINSNSIVAKLYYNNFTILFTGDIEKEAEEQIVKEYNDYLKSTVLKIAHHRV